MKGLLRVELLYQFADHATSQLRKQGKSYAKSPSGVLTGCLHSDKYNLLTLEFPIQEAR